MTRIPTSTNIFHCVAVGGELRGRGHTGGLCALLRTDCTSHYDTRPAARRARAAPTLLRSPPSRRGAHGGASVPSRLGPRSLPSQGPSRDSSFHTVLALSRLVRERSAAARGPHGRVPRCYESTRSPRAAPTHAACTCALTCDTCDVCVRVCGCVRACVI
jgi:hypothetical protein